jgi:GntR family transcriptional regulator
MTGVRAVDVALVLREDIALGTLSASGDGSLPSEAALAERFTASRVTVRRALEQLRAEGLVVSRRGVGWFVAGPAFHQPVALGSFRHAASAVAEAGREVTRRTVGFGYAEAAPPVVHALGLHDGAEVLVVRSVRSVDDVPLDLVDEWVPARLADGLSRADAERPGVWESLRRTGYDVDVVRQSVSATVAASDHSALLDVAVGGPLLLVRRLALGADGAPIALAEHRYLAHRFTLEMEFRGWSSAPSADSPGLRALPLQTP